MSAWAEIVNASGDDEWLEKCNLAIREIQRAALHRAAEKVRNADAELMVGSRDKAVLADLIDPDKDTP